MTDRITSPSVSSCELVLSEETKWSRPRSTWQVGPHHVLPHMLPFNVTTTSLNLATRGRINGQRGVSLALPFFSNRRAPLLFLHLLQSTPKLSANPLSALPPFFQLSTFRTFAIIQRYDFSSFLVHSGSFHPLHSSFHHHASIFSVFPLLDPR